MSNMTQKEIMDVKLTASSRSPGKSLKSGLLNSCLHSLHLAGGYNEQEYTKTVNKANRKYSSGGFIRDLALLIYL